MRSMLAPHPAMQVATAATAAGRSGWPRTVTCSCPPTRGASSSAPAATSTSMPMYSATSASSARTLASSSPTLTSTPSTSRPRMTTCSTSTTSMSAPARAPNSAEVTPGRSRPVTVTRSVRSAAMEGDLRALASGAMRYRGSRRPGRRRRRHLGRAHEGEAEPEHGNPQRGGPGDVDGHQRSGDVVEVLDVADGALGAQHGQQHGTPALGVGGGAVAMGPPHAVQGEDEEDPHGEAVEAGDVADDAREPLDELAVVVGGVGA